MPVFLSSCNWTDSVNKRFFRRIFGVVLWLDQFCRKETILKWIGRLSYSRGEVISSLIPSWPPGLKPMIRLNPRRISVPKQFSIEWEGHRWRVTSGKIWPSRDSLVLVLTLIEPVVLKPGHVMKPSDIFNFDISTDFQARKVQFRYNIQTSLV